MTTLADLVLSPEILVWGHELYLPINRSWELSTPCVIADPDEVDEAELEQVGLSYALGIAEVQDAIDNLRQQKPTATPQELLYAVQFYFEHDAFTNISAG